MKYLIFILLVLLHFYSCQSNRHTKVEKQFSDNSINKDSVVKSDNQLNNIFYIQRKNKYSKGDYIILDEKAFVFGKDLRLTSYDTLNNGKAIAINTELAPGVALIQQKPTYQLKGHSEQDNSVYIHKLIFYDSSFNVNKAFLIDKHNTFNSSLYKITCDKCVDGESAIANNWEKNPNYNLKENVHHYWTRPVKIGFNENGFTVINYSISARTLEDVWIDDINNFLVLDSNGKIIYRLDNVQIDVSRVDISLCGKFLIIHYGGAKTSDLDYLRTPGVNIYDLESNKLVMNFVQNIAIPIFERLGNYYILTHSDNNSHIQDYHKTMLFFEFTKRKLYTLEITKSQWDYISKNWFKILDYSKLLELYPSTSSSF